MHEVAPHIFAERLEKLAKLGHANSQYELVKYFHNQEEYAQALDWCLLAAYQQHQEAHNYLFTTEFSGKMYFKIGQSLDAVDDAKKNYKRIIFLFYNNI